MQSVRRRHHRRAIGRTGGRRNRPTAGCVQERQAHGRLAEAGTDPAELAIILRHGRAVHLSPPFRSGTLPAILSGIAGTLGAKTTLRAFCRAKTTELESGDMSIVAKILVALIALAHIYFLV